MNAGSIDTSRTMSLENSTHNEGHSNGARFKLLEKRIRGGVEKQSMTPSRALNFEVQHGFAPQPGEAPGASPEAKTPTEDSDGEQDSRDAFGIVNLTASRSRKRVRTKSPVKQATPTMTSQQRPHDLSPAPKTGGRAAGRGHGDVRTTPLKDRNGQCTPDTGKRSQQRIQKYFPSRGPNETSNGPFAQGSRHASDGICQGCEAARGTEAKWAAECQQLQQSLASSRQKEADAVKQASEVQAELSRLQQQWEESRSEVTDAEARLRDVREAVAVKEKEVRASLLEIATRAALAERDLVSRKLHHEAARLGTLTFGSAKSMGMREVWEDGPAFQEIASRQASLTQQREMIEAARKAVRKKLPLPEPLGEGARPKSAAQDDRIASEEFVARDEIFKARVASLKREEEALAKERERMELEKQRHLRELRRTKDEEASSFQCGCVLNARYMLQRLLGKGGFSEVFQAYDLDGMREVAVKVHQLSPGWTEAKKASYVKHATREFNIHRNLRHSRIVALLDFFELDANSFATVLELCTGGDLDAHLKEHQVLPEREARVIVAQIFQGLAYLNVDDRRIIHYDLKPANILFDPLGQVKITDFGLSKIVEEGQSQGMELTSQGAGTYWYLPPECFEISAHAPMISNKVDVWSAGVIHYQMLYSKRPFGEGLSQERILRDDVMLNARQVAFPAKPAVSQECKDFITRCLTYRQQGRMDVLAAAKDPYLALRRPHRQSSQGLKSECGL